MNTINTEKLKVIVNNIQYLEGQKKEINDQLAETYSNAKSDGFNTKIIKKLIAIKDPEKFKQEFSEFEVYADVIQPDLFN